MNYCLTNKFGLYIHIPFCSVKCPYCDFYSVSELFKINDYFLALNAELKLYQNMKYCVDTVYFGGGTPSIVDPIYIVKTFETIHKSFYVLPNSEITLEVNPGTVSYDDLLEYKKLGINRLNIGVQSLDNKALLFLGRLHDSNEALDVFYSARKIGFRNLGIDLIYGLPEQTIFTWQFEMEKIIDLEPEHLSCYLLSIEQGTRMNEKLLRGDFLQIKDSLVSKLFTFNSEFLNENGYNHYEISNFAKKAHDNSTDYVSKHNKKYWNFDNYLGFGPSAHSLIKNKRWWNYHCMDSYINSLLKYNCLPIAGKEYLSLEQEMTEFIYLGLRQNSGVNITLFKSKFNENLLDLFADSIKILGRDGFLKVQEDNLILTNSGLLLLDSIIMWF